MRHLLKAANPRQPPTTSPPPPTPQPTGACTAAPYPPFSDTANLQTSDKQTPPLLTFTLAAPHANPRLRMHSHHIRNQSLLLAHHAAHHTLPPHSLHDLCSQNEWALASPCSPPLLPPLSIPSSSSKTTSWHFACLDGAPPSLVSLMLSSAGDSAHSFCSVCDRSTKRHPLASAACGHDDVAVHKLLMKSSPRELLTASPTNEGDNDDFLHPQEHSAASGLSAAVVTQAPSSPTSPRRSSPATSPPSPPWSTATPTLFAASPSPSPPPAWPSTPPSCSASSTSSSPRPKPPPLPPLFAEPKKSS